MAANAFAALDNILTKQEQRKSADRQYALALMQFDYQKQQAAMARMQYKTSQIDKFIKWSIENKGHLKYKELIEFEKQIK